LEDFVADQIEELDYLSIIWPVMVAEDWAELRSQIRFGWSTSYTNKRIYLTDDPYRSLASNEHASSEHSKVRS